MCTAVTFVVFPLPEHAFYDCITAGAISGYDGTSVVFNGNVSFADNVAEGHGGEDSVEMSCLKGGYRADIGKVRTFRSWCTVLLSHARPRPRTPTPAAQAAIPETSCV